MTHSKLRVIHVIAVDALTIGGSLTWPRREFVCRTQLGRIKPLQPQTARGRSGSNRFSDSCNMAISQRFLEHESISRIRSWPPGDGIGGKDESGFTVLPPDKSFNTFLPNRFQKVPAWDGDDMIGSASTS